MPRVSYGIHDVQVVQSHWKLDQPHGVVCSVQYIFSRRYNDMTLHDLTELSKKDVITMKRFITRAQSRVLSKYRRRVFGRMYSKGTREKMASESMNIENEIRRLRVENADIREKIRSLNVQMHGVSVLEEEILSLDHDVKKNKEREANKKKEPKKSMKPRRSLEVRRWTPSPEEVLDIGASPTQENMSSYEAVRLWNEAVTQVEEEANSQKEMMRMRAHVQQVESIRAMQSPVNEVYCDPLRNKSLFEMLTIIDNYTPDDEEFNPEDWNEGLTSGEPVPMIV